MKSSKFTCYIFLGILLFSCTKDQDDQISLDQLLGTWRMSEAQINGTQISDYVENGVWLDLEDKGNFYLHYIIGSWYLGILKEIVYF